MARDSLRVRSQKHAFTLVELLVTMGLFLMLLVLAGRLFGSALGNSTKMNNRAALHSALTRTSRWLVSDLANASIAYFLAIPQTTASDPFTAGFVLSNGSDSTGALVWEERYTVYHWEPSTRELKRETGSPGTGWSPTQPVLPDPALLNQVLAGAKSSSRALSNQVTDFQIRVDAGALIVFRLQVEGQEKRPISMERTVRARN